MATVRRLEGVYLHPVVDPSGVHRFNPREVDALAREIEKPRELRKVEPSEITSSESEGFAACIDCARLRERVKHLEAELSGAALSHVAELDALRDSWRLTLATTEDDQRKLESALAELLEALDE